MISSASSSSGKTCGDGRVRSDPLVFTWVSPPMVVRKSATPSDCCAMAGTPARAAVSAATARNVPCPAMTASPSSGGVLRPVSRVLATLHSTRRRHL
jgi:hypothetical protein